MSDGFGADMHEAVWASGVDLLLLLGDSLFAITNARKPSAFVHICDGSLGS